MRLGEVARTCDQPNDGGEGLPTCVGPRPAFRRGTRCAGSVNHLAGARRHGVRMPGGRLHQTPSCGGRKVPCSVNFSRIKVD